MLMEQTSLETGLSSAEASARLRLEGHNELPSSERRTVLRIAGDVLREPMFLILVACGVIYLFLGDHQEALILLGFVLVVAAITLYQEQKTEHALAALRNLASPRALVLRDGVRVRIAGREVVRGDLLILADGDRIAADAGLVGCAHLFADESLLSGESAPVLKTAWDGALPLPPRRGRLAVRLRRNAGHPRPRGGAGPRHRPRHRDGPDWSRAAHRGARTQRSSARDRPPGWAPGRRRRRALHPGCPGLWVQPRLADGPSGRSALWRWPSFPTSFRPCWPSSWRWGPGESHRSEPLPDVCPSSRALARPLSCASTRPGP